MSIERKKKEREMAVATKKGRSGKERDNAVVAGEDNNGEEISSSHPPTKSLKSSKKKKNNKKEKSEELITDDHDTKARCKRKKNNRKSNDDDDKNEGKIDDDDKKASHSKSTKEKKKTRSFSVEQETTDDDEGTVDVSDKKATKKGTKKKKKAVTKGDTSYNKKSKKKTSRSSDDNADVHLTTDDANGKKDKLKVNKSANDDGGENKLPTKKKKTSKKSKKRKNISMDSKGDKKGRGTSSTTSNTYDESDPCNDKNLTPQDSEGMVVVIPQEKMRESDQSQEKRKGKVLPEKSALQKKAQIRESDLDEFFDSSEEEDEERQIIENEIDYSASEESITVKEWLKPKLPMGRLHLIKGEGERPTFLPPGRDSDGRRPSRLEYVYGDGKIGTGYYSIYTLDAYHLLTKRMHKAQALVQAEIDAYDCNNCFFLAPTKSSKTKQAEKEVFATIKQEIITLTKLVEARAEAMNPSVDITREELMEESIYPDEELEPGFTMVHAVNDTPSVMQAVVNLLKVLCEYVFPVDHISAILLSQYTIGNVLPI